MRASSCSVPGSLMLMGEHAVLQGMQALSAAIDKRLTVHLQPRDDDKLIINSKLGTYSSTIDNIQQDLRFRFVLGCLEGIKNGLELEIESQFSHQVGLGSSAAVTIATLGALLGPSCDQQVLFDKSLSVVRKVQGRASGADVAASLFGGIIHYRMEPRSIVSLPHLVPLTVIYSGSKMATSEVVAQVQSKNANHQSLLFHAMDQLVTEAKEAIINQDLQLLGTLFNVHHGLQEAIGTCNRSLAEIVHMLREQSSIYGAKISGSGLGDCAIGLGTAQLNCRYEQIPVSLSKEGILFL